jgi:hypothetical protein
VAVGGVSTRRQSAAGRLVDVDQRARFRKSASAGAFREGLQKLGWAEGRNLRIDYRWGGGSIERMRTYAAELVALKPDVILGDSLRWQWPHDRL